MAFRVNQITDKFTPWFGSPSKRPRGSHGRTSNDEGKDDDDSDSDSSGSDDSGYDGTTTRSHTILSAAESYNSSVDSVWYMPQDARLSRRWNFDYQIPLLGWFWQYRPWNWRSREKVDIDYPLHHALYVTRWFVLRRVVGPLARLGSQRLRSWVFAKLRDADQERMMRVLKVLEPDLWEQMQRRRHGPVLSQGDPGPDDAAWTSSARPGGSPV